jgi:hypothetical protein
MIYILVVLGIVVYFLIGTQIMRLFVLTIMTVTSYRPDDRCYPERLNTYDDSAALILFCIMVWPAVMAITPFAAMHYLMTKTNCARSLRRLFFRIVNWLMGLHESKGE